MKDKNLREALGYSESKEMYWGVDTTTIRIERINKINKKLDAILDHLGLEYFEEEKKESGLRKKTRFSMPHGLPFRVLDLINEKPRKRGRKKVSKNKKK